MHQRIVSFQYDSYFFQVVFNSTKPTRKTHSPSRVFIHPRNASKGLCLTFFVWTPTRWKSNFTLQRILEGSSQWMVQWLVSMVIVSPLSRVAGPQARRNSDNLNTHPSKKQARRKSQSHRDFSVSCQSIFGNEPVNGERPLLHKKNRFTPERRKVGRWPL